jgi:hypothetical protein
MPNQLYIAARSVLPTMIFMGVLGIGEPTAL